LAQVRDFALQIIEFLFDRGADAVVMGCNMSSASGAHEVAVSRFAKPVFEVIQPGSQAACSSSSCGKIGVIATQGTVNSGVYGRSLRRQGAQEVYEQPCPAFVPLIERGFADGPEVETAIVEYLTPLRDAGVDTLIFGCTHYPFLRDAIGKFMGDTVTLIDPGEYAAREVADRFRGVASAFVPNGNHKRHRFFCSGNPESLQREGERFLGIPLLAVEQVDVPIEALVP
jgi:glutamate racemase